MNHLKAEILIVGGGPVGLASAISFSRAGFEVRVIDKKADITKESRALAVHARTMEIFHKLGVVHEFLEQAFRVQGFNFYNQGKPIARLMLDQLDTPYAAVFALPQAKTERILSEYLNKTYGIAIERNTELLDFENREEKVVARIKKTNDDGEEKEEIVEVKYLIGCDGAHSIVRKKLGLRFDGISIKTKWYFMDAEIETDLPSRDGFNMILEGKSLLLLIPMGDNVYRILIDADSSNGSGAELTKDAYIKVAKSFISPYKLDVKSVMWYTSFQVNERKVEEFSQGRVFLCGDAAHIHSPAGGQGMNTGIQDGYNLAWKLSVIEHHNGNRVTLISSYTQERDPIAASVLGMSGALLRTFLSNTSFISHMRSQIVYMFSFVPYIRTIMAQRLAGFAIEYPQGPLTVPHGGWFTQGPTSIKAGCRVPNIIISNSVEKSLFDIFSESDTFFLLLWIPSNGVSKSISYLEILKTKISDLQDSYGGNASFIQPLIITDNLGKDNEESFPILNETFGSMFNANFDSIKSKFGFTQNDPVILVVRPDGYLGLAIYLQNLSRIDEYFKQFMS